MAGTVLQAFVFRDGTFLGTEMVTGERFAIGRDLSCGLVIEDDDLVSRKHVQVSVVGNKVYVEDLQSANGTSVNGEPLSGRRQLSGRDDVFVGHHTVKFKLLSAGPSAMAPAPPAPGDDATEVHDMDPDLMAAPPERAPTAPQQPMAEPVAAPRSPHPWRDLSSSAPSSGEAAAPPAAAVPGLGDDIFAGVSGLNGEGGQAPLDAAFELPPPPPPLEGGMTDPLAAALQQPQAPAAVAPVSVAPAQPTPPPPEPVAPVAPVQPVPLAPQPAAVQAPIGPGPAAADSLSLDLAQPTEATEALRMPALDEDEDFDPDDAPAPFSLLENLLKETFKDGRIQQVKTPLLEVIRYQDSVVHELESLGKGQIYVVGQGLTKKEAQRIGMPANHKLARLRRDGSVDLAVQKDFQGKVRVGGSSKALNEAASWSGEKGMIRLSAGDIANLQIGSEQYFVRFAYPPAVARKISQRGKPSVEERRERRWLGLSFAGSGGSHAAVLAIMFIIGLISPSQLVTQLEEDRFVQVDMKELELEKPPEEEPPEEVIEVVEEIPEEPQPKKAPPRQRLTNPKGKTKKPGILAALGKIPKRAGAAGSQTLTAAVSNLDAVKVPGGGASYKVSGLIGKGPSKRVQIGGSGGGVATKGLASILREGGGGPGTLSKLKRGKVRGRLVKASRGSKTKGSGYLDRAEIQKVVNKGLGQIQFCYEKELLKNTSLSGKVVFEWHIAPSGKVSIVKTNTATLKSNAAVQCMISKIKRWKFPKPRGGSVIVTYPFIFNAMGF